jgi:hypothetical protein
MCGKKESGGDTDNDGKVWYGHHGGLQRLPLGRLRVERVPDALQDTGPRHKEATVRVRPAPNAPEEGRNRLGSVTQSSSISGMRGANQALGHGFGDFKLVPRQQARTTAIDCGGVRVEESGADDEVQVLPLQTVGAVLRAEI